MLMTLNSFSDCLSERMLTCMHRGCGVISQGNQLIDDTFQHEQDILRLDDNLANFDDIMEQAQDPGLLKEITKNAYEKVKDEYSPEYRVNQIFEVLESKGVLRNHQRVVIEGHDDGEITSGGFSPTLERSIAMARMPAGDYDHARVEVRKRLLEVRVVSMPFVRNGKVRIDV